MKEALELIGMTKTWPDFRLSVNFSIAKGDFACIIGPSGSGKTTVLRMIAGLEFPDSGLIRVFDEDIGGLPPEKRNIGLVFQDLALFPHLDVFSNIAYGLRAKGLARREAETRVNALIESLGLDGFAGRSVFSLSGGEQQRVALARAMAPEPRILLFDEPLSSIDASLRKELRRDIRNFVKKAGLTAVYVTHDQEEALALSDILIVMNGGRVERTGRPEVLYHDPGTRFTAEFIGEGNCIPVAGFEPDRFGGEGILARTDLGAFSIGGPTSSEAALLRERGVLDKSFSVFFRREDVLVGRTGVQKDEPNSFHAVLEDYEYLGKAFLFFFRASGKIITAESSFEGRPVRGDSFRLSVPVEKCGIVED